MNPSFVSFTIENYKNNVNLFKAMETEQKIEGIGVTIGSIIGYVIIIAGIIMTFLLLESLLLSK